MLENDNLPSHILPESPPACQSCGRACEAGSTWPGANLCRGLVLLRHIEDAPGLSAWELARTSGLAYADAQRGLMKLREYGVVSTESEERDQGGVRYRYWKSGDPAARERFLTALRRAEAL